MALDLEEAPSSMEVELPAGAGSETLLQSSAIPNSLRNCAKMAGMTKNGVDFRRKIGDTVGISTWILGCSTNNFEISRCVKMGYTPQLHVGRKNDHKPVDDGPLCQGA